MCMLTLPPSRLRFTPWPLHIVATCGYLNVVKFIKPKNSVFWSHQPHFQYSVVTCMCLLCCTYLDDTAQDTTSFITVERSSGRPYDGMLPASLTFPSCTFLDNVHLSKVTSILTFTISWFFLSFGYMGSYSVCSSVSGFFFTHL